MGFEDLITKADLETALKSVLAAAAKMAVPAKKEKYITFEQALDYIKDSPSKLGQKVRNGEIPYIRDGRLIKFLIDDLDRHMMAHRVMSNAEIASKASCKG